MRSFMVRRVSAVSVALGLLVSSAGAFAQGTGTAARCADASNTGAATRNQTFCFEAERVSGSLVGPYGQGVTTVRRLGGTSLIRHRAHFVPEMLRSVEAF